nr:hypothetical protein [Myxococcaceae bacterium]
APLGGQSVFPKWEVYVSGLGAFRPDTAGAGLLGGLGVTRELTRWLRLDGLVGAGAMTGPLDVIVTFRVGARLEWPGEARVRPFLAVAFAHQHEASWGDFVQHPVAVTLSQSEHVHHRSGIDTALGLSVDLPRTRASVLAGRLMVRGGVVHLLGHGSPRALELIVGFGACF